jgi:hypothetical protein
MQPLLPMLVRDQWSDTASTRPARKIPRRSETARRPSTSTAAHPVLAAAA